MNAAAPQLREDASAADAALAFRGAPERRSFAAAATHRADSAALIFLGRNRPRTLNALIAWARFGEARAEKRFASAEVTPGADTDAPGCLDFSLASRPGSPVAALAARAVGDDVRVPRSSAARREAAA